MADRTSAEIFGTIFDYLAAAKPISKDELVAYLWKATWDYDFNYCQMGCDDALMALGLAWECDGCGNTLYKDDDECEECEYRKGEE